MTVAPTTPPVCGWCASSAERPLPGARPGQVTLVAAMSIAASTESSGQRTGFVARQPITDRQRRIVGYELLFRAAREHTRAEIADGDRATAALLDATLLDHGLQHVVGRHWAFINVTHRFIVSEAPWRLPRSRVVLELLEHVTVDEPLRRALWRLSEAGYRLALDDFVAESAHDMLLPLVDIVKVDVQGLDAQAIRGRAEALRDAVPMLLAEKVETAWQWQACREAGFALFQGYYLGRPELVAPELLERSEWQQIERIADLLDAPCEPPEQPS